MSIVHDLVVLNRDLGKLDAAQRIAYALQRLPGNHVASTSFGAQSAAFLHLLQRVQPQLPIVFVDTQFLYPETYEFAELLSSKLALNVRRIAPLNSAQWSETAVKNLNNQGLEAITRYNVAHKVQPMQAELARQNCMSWFAGLRRSSANSRAALEFVSWQNGRYKVHPLADWTDRDIGKYLAANDLPYHPLWAQGYVSIGDRYLTRPLTEAESAAGADASEQTRFFGLKRECGLHEAQDDLAPRFAWSANG